MLLRDQHRRVPALADGERDLATVFELSYAALDERHRLLLRRLSLVPGPDADAHAAAALLECDPDARADCWRVSSTTACLSRTYPGRYQLHDLLRAHARAVTGDDPPPETESAVDRLLDHYQDTADRADALVSRHPRARPATVPPGVRTRTTRFGQRVVVVARRAPQPARCR